MESRLAALEMQMKEVMNHTSLSYFFCNYATSSYLQRTCNGNQNKQRQQHHVPHHAHTVHLPVSFNNKPAYNTDFPLPSLTQTNHSAPHHGQTQQDPNNSGHAWNTVKGSRPRTGGRDMRGWSEQVEPERDRSLFWHWMWCELYNPTNKGIVYDVM